MKGLHAARTGTAAVAMLLICSKANALPFSITAVPNTNFPASINYGQSVNAILQVTNISGVNLNGIKLTNLPAGIRQVTTDLLYPKLCGATFSLSNGDYCTLEFAIDSAIINATNAYNLTLTIPGTPANTTQGFSLNIPWSGWTLIGSSSSGAPTGYVEALVPNNTTLYAIGHSPNELSTLWSYTNGAWTNIYQGTADTTGPASVFQALAFKNTTQGYVSGHNDAYATVFALDTSTNPATITDLHYQDNAATTSGQPENSVQVDSILYSPSNGLVYIGGESNIDHINNYGVVYTYNPNTSTWTNLGLENTIFVDALIISNGYLYTAAIGEGVNFAEILSYPLSGGSWSNLSLPNTVIEIHALAVDSNGTLYAGGYDNFGGTVWKYESGQWTSLHFTGGSEVKSLSIGPNNVLYAAGINNTFGGGVWTYSNGVWTTKNPASSSFVNSIALLSGTIFTAGENYVAEQNIWQQFI